MLEAYAGIRDRIAYDLTAAWGLSSDNLIWVKQSELAPTSYPDVTARRVPQIALDPLGVMNDVATLIFEIAARWALVEGMDQDLFSVEMVDKFRDRVSTAHYTACGFDPRVTSFDLIEGEPGDKYMEVRLHFQVKIVAERTNPSSHDGVEAVGPG